MDVALSIRVGILSSLRRAVKPSPRLYQLRMVVAGIHLVGGMLIRIACPIILQTQPVTAYSY